MQDLGYKRLRRMGLGLQGPLPGGQRPPFRAEDIKQERATAIL